MKYKIKILVCLLLLALLAVSCSFKPGGNDGLPTAATIPSASGDCIPIPSGEGIPTSPGDCIPIPHGEGIPLLSVVETILGKVPGSEEVILEETGPVTEIKDASGLFRLWGETTKLYSYMTVVVDEGGARKWGMGDGGLIHPGIAVKSDGMGKVYLVSPGDGSIKEIGGEVGNELGKEIVKGIGKEIITDITRLVDEAGIHIPGMNVKILRAIDDVVLVKISDGSKEALFLFKWDREKQSHEAVLLDSCGIIAADFYYTFDNSVFVTSENDGFYILHRDEQDNDLKRYVLPGIIREIEDILLAWEEDRYYVFIKAYKENDEKLAFYKVDINRGTITEYRALKSLKDMYAPEWTFKSDVNLNRYADMAAGLILVEGSDSRLSGFHDHNYLYALDTSSGEKTWTFYGNHAGVPYRFSKDREHVFLGNLAEGYIKCLEINTGKLIWKKEAGNYFEFASAGENVLVRSDNTIKAYRASDGELQWERETSEDAFLFASKNNLPVVVVSDSKGLAAYNPASGDIEWQFPGKGCRNYDISLDGTVLTVPFENAIQTLDIHTGTTIEINASSYSAIEETLSGKELYSGVKVLYSKEDERIRCIDNAGKILWERDYKPGRTTDLYKYNPYFQYPYPARIGDVLYINFEGAIIALDAKTGETLYQAADYATISSGPVKLKDSVLWILNDLDGQVDALRLK
ncbi:MAG: PQQ-binding-like beta-propeller repeat protein [Clostridiaceae bacterium]|nr:PQQ-binding-like beta-propeller repeat protein [Clostridiaceae bacterium]